VISRDEHRKKVGKLLRSFPVTALLGARQVGKTTLSHQIERDWRGSATRFDLEDPTDLSRLADPPLALRSLRGLVVIDEIQRSPDLFPLLRVLADRPKTPARFLILGSASPGLLKQSSETLAGRIAYHFLPGFDLSETGTKQAERLWLRGGFPRSFTARSPKESETWRKNFLRTFLERDLPQLGVTIPATTLRRFWTMLAHGHGQVWNASEFGRAFGVADTTVRRYLDLLVSTFLVRLLLPWRENLKKRQVRSPKIYLSDSGLLHTLLGLRTKSDLLGHPKVGASWEGFALAQVIARLGAEPEECYFWGTHAGAELDLLVLRGRRRLGFEFKHSSQPRLTKSMRIAMDDLRLSSLDIIYPGEKIFPLASKIRAVGISILPDSVRPLR
jgi:predicted AAA+ superfamily ATPase